MLKVLEGLYRASHDYGNAIGLPACFLTSRQDSTESETAKVHRHSSDQSNSQEASVLDENQAGKNAADSNVTSDGRHDNGSMKVEKQQQSDETQTAVKVAESKETQGGGRRESVYVRDEQQMRILFELLQTFFRDFIGSLHLVSMSAEPYVCEVCKSVDCPDPTKLSPVSEGEGSIPIRTFSTSNIVILMFGTGCQGFFLCVCTPVCCSLS